MKRFVLLPIVLGFTSVGFAQQPKPKKVPEPPEGVEVARDLEYAVHDGVSLKLDL